MTNGKDRILAEARTVKRNRPVNFDEADLPIFRKDLEREINPTVLHHVRNNRVTYDGLLLDGLKVNPISIKNDSIRRQLDYRYWLSNTIRGKKLKPDRGRQYLMVHNYYWQGYFHWFTESLTRLYAVRDMLDSVTLLMPEPIFDFHRSSLLSFNLQDVKYLQPGEYAHVRDLIIPSFTAPPGNYNREYIRGVASLTRNYFGIDDGQKGNEKIYISRQKAAKRKVANESELEPLLEEFGYRLIFMEELTFREQVELCASSKAMISLHGGGLTNMMFMSPGADVFELRMKDDAQNNCYFSLATEFDHRYHYLISPRTDPNESSHTANIIVDPAKFRRILESMDS